MKKTFIAGLLVAGVGIYVYAQNSNKVTPQSSKEDTIRIATDGAYPPYIGTNTDGTLFGFEADLAKELCTRIQKKCEWVKQSFDGAIPSLRAGRFDAIMSSLSITDKRREVVDFTLPYFTGPTVFMAKADSKYANAETGLITLDKLSEDESTSLATFASHLKGATIGVQLATSHEELVKEFFNKDTKAKAYTASEQMFLDLASGRVDVIVIGSGELSDVFLAEQEEKGRALKEIGPSLKGGVLGQGVAIAVRQGSDILQQQFNQAIRAANQEGVIKDLGLRWFKFDGSPVHEATVSEK